jgi:hypothetical protein
MSGAIVMHFGGPICWKANQQERTSLSSCKVEIHAMNMGSRLTVNTCSMISHLSSLGYPIDNATHPIILYNNNNACIKWCHNMTTKGNRHIENHKNSTRKWVADGTIAVKHVSGKCITADLFMKERQDGANFRRLCDVFMCRSSDFLQSAHNIAHSPPSSDFLVLAKSIGYVGPLNPGILDVLISFPSPSLPSMLSSISSTGHHILSRLAPSSCMQALLSNPMGVAW